MKLIWVKGKTPLSKLIMWGLDEPVSHFAIEFDNKIVFHSDLRGTHIQWSKTFYKNRDLVFELEYKPGLNKEEEIYQTILDTYDGSSYDYGGFLYFCWRAALKKFFKKPLPDSNPWGSKKSFICDEVVQLLPDDVCPPEVKDMDLSIKSPYQVWMLLNNKTV